MDLIPEPRRDRAHEHLLPTLSMIERRVGALVAAGYEEIEIARHLLMSPQRVEWTVAKLCRTFEAASRAELAEQLRALSGS